MSNPNFINNYCKCDKVLRKNLRTSSNCHGNEEVVTEDNTSFSTQLNAIRSTVVSPFLNNKDDKERLEHLYSNNLLPRRVDWKGMVHDYQNFDFLGDPIPYLLSRLFEFERRDAKNLVAASCVDLFSLAIKAQQSQRPRILNKLRQTNGALRELPFYSIPWSISNDRIITKFCHLKTITGHRLPSYCVIFDKSDRRLITGGDDGVVKIWCSRTGFLLYSLRAHSNCISDLSIDTSNTVLAIGSMDGYISFWDIRLGIHLFTINAFSPILTLEFRPVEQASSEVILMATCSDGYAKFWCINLQQRIFTTTPIKFHCKSLARDEIRCATFSPAGTRFVSGATDGIVRLFSVPEVADIKSGNNSYTTVPYLQYLEDHEGYINSVHFSSNGDQLATSSWDGTVRQWKYDLQKKSWASTAHNTTAVLGQSQDEVVPGRPHKVTIVTYCCQDKCLVAAVGRTFELVVFYLDDQTKFNILKYHTGDVYILTVNPVDDRIVLSAGCDGLIAVWNIESGERVFEFESPNTRFLDGGFSSNGAMFSLVDDLGRISLFGCGISPDCYLEAPNSQFYSHEWNELVFDNQHNAIDAITQQPPHLAPRNTIVSIEKLPYPNVIKDTYTSTIPIELEDQLLLEKQQNQFLKQLNIETALFKLELKNTPKGTIPKHSRTRRKRLLYGSDVEEDERPLLGDAAPNAVNGYVDESSNYEDSERPSNESASSTSDNEEVSITSESDEDHEDLPYNFRHRMNLHRAGHQNERRRIVIAELDEDDDQLYRPTAVRSSRSSNQSRNRRSRHIDSSNESISLSVPSWVSISDRQVFPYLPQIYDVVAYFPQGHRQFLSRETRSSFRHPPSRPLGAVVFGQVISLNFFPGPPVWCQIEILTLDSSEVKESLPPPISIPTNADRLKISFYDMENSPDFIIPYCRYKWSVLPEQLFDVGEVVRVVFGNEESYSAKVKRLKVPKDRIVEQPWQCYVVEWLTLDEKPEPLSPWELETIFDEDSPQRTSYSCQEFIEVEVLQVLDDGIKKLMNDPRASSFKHAVDLGQFPNYLEYVAYPMDLSLLHQRIINGYHRRIESFEWDCRLIYENAYSFNLPDSDIVADADFILQELLRLVKKAERGTRRTSGKLVIREASSPTTPEVSARSLRALRRSQNDSQSTPLQEMFRIGKRKSPSRSTPTHKEAKSPKTKRSRIISYSSSDQSEDYDSDESTHEEELPRTTTRSSRRDRTISNRDVQLYTPLSRNVRRSARFTN